jgi:hypothetical protein
MQALNCQHDSKNGKMRGCMCQQSSVALKCVAHHVHRTERFCGTEVWYFMAHRTNKSDRVVRACASLGVPLWMVRTFTGVRGWMCRSVLLCADLGTQSCEEGHVVKKKKMQMDSNQTTATVTTLRSNPSAGMRN